jgi:hypothetical protein
MSFVIPAWLKDIRQQETRGLPRSRTEFISKQMKKDSGKENRHKVCYKVVLDGEAFIRYYFEILKL